MLRACTLIVLSVLVLPQGSSRLEACGDKFLLVGRSARFRQAYAAIYRANIVVFAQPQRSAAKAIRDPRLQADLKAAGHHVTIAEDERALARAFESDSVDFVLTDAADADRIAAQVNGLPTSPKVLPVMFEPSKDQAKAIEAKYHCKITSSDRADRYLTTIDDMMKARVSLKKKAKS